MNIYDIFGLDKYDEAYQFISKNKGTEIKDLGNKTYQIIKSSEPTVEEQNEAIRQTRLSLYKNNTDELTLRKLRKQALGTWTRQDEEEYLSEIKKMSEDINNGNPYIKE